MEEKVNAGPVASPAATKDHASSPAESDLRRAVCRDDDGPCKEPAPKPAPKPVVADTPRKATAPTVVTKGTAASAGSARNGVQQPCPAGQVWGGIQCLPIGAQQCLAGQSRVGATCQADCTIAAAGGENVIVELRSARQTKDEVCLKNPTGRECQEAEAHYNLTLNEYRNFLGGVPTECRTSLPDPIAI